MKRAHPVRSVAGKRVTRRLAGSQFIRGAMSDTKAENQRHLTDRELKNRIARLEKTLREKETTVAALQDSDKRYRRLFESAQDGILILNAETGKVVDVNPLLRQLLGYSYDAIYGQYIWEIGVFKDIAASKEAFQVLQENEYIRYEDLPLETQDGRPIAVEFVSNVYVVDHTKVIQRKLDELFYRELWDTISGGYIQPTLSYTGVCWMRARTSSRSPFP